MVDYIWKMKIMLMLNYEYFFGYMKNKYII